MLLITLIVTACNTSEEVTPPACDSGGLLIALTATHPVYVPPTLSNSSEGAVYCPTAAPDDIALATIYPEQFTTAEITNLPLDSGDQELAATAVGDDMTALAISFPVWKRKAAVTYLLSKRLTYVDINGVSLMKGHPQGEVMIADRFLAGDALLQENLALHTCGEGMILVDDEAFFTSWNGRYNGCQSVARIINI